MVREELGRKEGKRGKEKIFLKKEGEKGRGGGV